MQYSWIYNAVSTVHKNTWAGPTQNLHIKAHTVRTNIKGKLYLTDGHYMIPIFLNKHQQGTEQGSEDISRIISGTELRIKSFDFKVAKRVQVGEDQVLYILLCDWSTVRKPNKINSKKLVDINTLPMVQEILLTHSGITKLSQSSGPKGSNQTLSHIESQLAPGYCLRLSEETYSMFVDGSRKQKLPPTAEQTSISLSFSGPEENLTIPVNIATQKDNLTVNEHLYPCNCQTLKPKPDFHYWVIPPDQQRILDGIYALPWRHGPHKVCQDNLQQNSVKRLCVRPIPEKRIHNGTSPVDELALLGCVDAGRKQKEHHSTEKTTLVTSGCSPTSGPEEALTTPINIATQNSTTDDNVCQCDSQTLKCKQDFSCWKIPEDQQRILDNITEWRSSYQPNLYSSLLFSQVTSDVEMCTDPRSQAPRAKSQFREDQNRTNPVMKCHTETNVDISMDNANSGSLFSDIEENSECINSSKCTSSIDPEFLYLLGNSKVARIKPVGQTRVVSSGVSSEPSTSPFSEHSLKGQDSFHCDPTNQQSSSESENAATVKSLRLNLSLQSLNQALSFPVVAQGGQDGRVSEVNKSACVRRVCKASSQSSQGEVSAGKKKKLIPFKEQTSPAPSDQATQDSLISVHSFSPAFHVKQNLNITQNKTVTTTQNDSTTDEECCQCNSQIIKSKPDFDYWFIPDDQKQILDTIPEWKSSYQPILSSWSVPSYGGDEVDMSTGQGEPETNLSGERQNRTNPSSGEHQNRTNSVINSQEQTQTNKDTSIEKVNSGSLFSDIEEDSDKFINSNQYPSDCETVRLSKNKMVDINNKTCRQQQWQTRVVSSGISGSCGKRSTSLLSETSLQAQETCHSDPTVHQLSSEGQMAATVISHRCDLSLQQQVLHIPVVELCDNSDSLNAILSFISSGNKAGFIHK